MCGAFELAEPPLEGTAGLPSHFGQKTVIASNRDARSAVCVWCNLCCIHCWTLNVQNIECWTLSRREHFDTFSKRCARSGYRVKSARPQTHRATMSKKLIKLNLSESQLTAVCSVCSAPVSCDSRRLLGPVNQLDCSPPECSSAVCLVPLSLDHNYAWNWCVVKIIHQLNRVKPAVGKMDVAQVGNREVVGAAWERAVGAKWHTGSELVENEWKKMNY